MTAARAPPARVSSAPASSWSGSSRSSVRRRAGGPACRALRPPRSAGAPARDGRRAGGEVGVRRGRGAERRTGPPGPPARLHGDLWWGNVHFGRDGRAWLLDPAAHGGHRETALAMLALFSILGARFALCLPAAKVKRYYGVFLLFIGVRFLFLP